MKTINERVSDVSYHLQSLTAPEYISEVQDAVERKDKHALFRLCSKAKVPKSYLNVVVSVMLAVSPQQKWPEPL
jgi:hypothetical protein